jgi:hypothetical protein
MYALSYGRAQIYQFSLVRAAVGLVPDRSLFFFPLHDPAAVLAGLTCSFVLQRTTRSPFFGRHPSLVLCCRLVSERHDRRRADRPQVAAKHLAHGILFSVYPALKRAELIPAALKFATQA